MSLPKVGAQATLEGVQQFLANANQLKAAMTGVNAALNSMPAAGANASKGLVAVGAATSAVTAGLSGLGRAVAIGVTAFVALSAAAASAAVSIVATGVNLASDFQENIQKVAAVTDSTREELEALRQTANVVSLETGKSLTDVSKGAFELAKGGVELKTQLGGALKSVVDLSIASGGERGLAEAARDVAIGIKAFKLEGEDAARVADALTTGAQKSTASFQDMGVGLSYVASTAAALGLTIEQTTGLLGVLANAGLRGSTAGTNLRQALIALIDPSKEGAKVMAQYGISLYDAAGASRPFEDVLIDLTKAFGDAAVEQGKLTNEQRLYALNAIFTTRGANAVLALIQQGVEALDEFTNATTRLSASDVAKRMLLPLNQQFNILVNAVKVALNALGEGFIPILSEATSAAIRFISQGANVTKILQSIGLALSSIATGQGLGEVFKLLGEGGLQQGSNAEKAIRAVINVLLELRQAVVGQIIPALGRLFEAIGNAVPGDDVSTKWENVGQVIQTIIAVIGNTIAVMIDFIPPAVEALGTIVEAFSLIIQAAGVLLEAIGVAFSSAFDIIVSFVTGVIDDIGALIGAFGLIADAVTALVNHFEINIPNVAKVVVLGMVSPVGAALATLANALSIASGGSVDFVNIFGNAFSKLGEGVVNIIRGIVQAISGLIGAVASAAGGLAELAEAAGVPAGAINAAAGSLRFLAQAAIPIPIVFQNVAKTAIVAGAEISQSIGSLGKDFENFGTTSSAAVTSAKNKLDEIGPRLAALGDRIKSVPKLQDSFERVERGFNLDNLIKAFGGVADRAKDVNDRVRETTPGIDNLGKAGGDSGKKLENALEEVENMLLKLNNDFDEIDRNAAQKITNIADNVRDKLVEAVKEAGEAADKAWKKADDAIDKLNQSVKDDRALRQRRQDFEDSLNEETKIFQRHLEDMEQAERASIERTKRSRQRAIEDLELALSRAQDAESRARGFALDDERQRRSDLLEDTREQRSRERELIVQKFRDEQERAAESAKKQGLTGAELNEFKRNQDLAYTKFKQGLDDEEKDRRRAEERDERARRRAEDEAELRIKQQQQDQERLRRRQQQDSEFEEDLDRQKQQLVKKRKIEETEEEFKKGQRKKRQDFEDAEENKRIQQRIEEIKAERDERVLEILALLEKKQQKIVDDAEKEVKTYRNALEERIADLRDALLVKTPQMVKDHGDLIQPAIDNLFNVFDTRANKTIQLYHDMVDALQEFIEVEKNSSSGSGPTSSESGGGSSAEQEPQKTSTYYTPDTPIYDPNTGLYHSMQQGGYITEPGLVYAHPGEMFSGVNFEFGDRIAASLAARITPLLLPASLTNVASQSTVVSNNNSYNVEAHYRHEQSPASIEQDMQALVMMSQR